MLLWAFLALLTEPAGLQAGPYGCLMMKTSRAILAVKVAASSVVVHGCRKLQVVADIVRSAVDTHHQDKGYINVVQSCSSYDSLLILCNHGKNGLLFIIVVLF